MATMYCPTCGNKLYGNRTMCPKCEFKYKDDEEMKKKALRRYTGQLINNFDVTEANKPLREKYPTNWHSFGYSGGGCSPK